MARFAPRVQEMGGKLVFSSLSTRGSSITIHLVSLRVELRPIEEEYFALVVSQLTGGSSSGPITESRIEGELF